MPPAKRSRSLRVDSIRDSAEQFFVAGPSPELSSAAGTQAEIVDAARRCLIRYGEAKMSVSDVAEVAGLSRASIYNHFRGRSELIEAVLEMGTELAMADTSAALELPGSLAERLGAAGVVVVRWRRAGLRSDWGGIGDQRVMRRITLSPLILSLLMDTLRLTLTAARAAGEIRGGLDIESGCEWLARMLLSLFTTPATSFDDDDEVKIANFMATYAVQGLT